MAYDPGSQLLQTLNKVASLPKWGCPLVLRSFFLMAVVTIPGCAYFTQQVTPERLDQGFTVVLPGIEGKSVFNSNIAQGLIHGGVKSAVEVHDWTTGHLPLFLVHLRHIERNRDEARKLAQIIVEYQDRYPDRPVYLVGHSGGGGMALLTLEALPPDRKVTGVILLAVAVSRTFDLREALSKTERGIWNFYSPGDLVFLVAGTTLAQKLADGPMPAKESAPSPGPAWRWRWVNRPSTRDRGR